MQNLKQKKVQQEKSDFAICIHIMIMLTITDEESNSKIAEVPEHLMSPQTERLNT